MLATIFAGVKDGTCVEVGAHNGVEFSNTSHFEQIGWQCILVEPNPRLRAEIRKRRKSVLFECAASDREGAAVLHVPEGGDFLSTMEAGRSLARIQSITSVADVSVETATLDGLLERAGVSNIAFVLIDVEGHELSVLRGFSPSRWKPRVLVVESNFGFSENPGTHANA